jgi:hypothetical protein
VYIDGVFVSLEEFESTSSEPHHHTKPTTPLSKSFSVSVISHAMHEKKKLPTTLWAPEGPRIAKMSLGLSISITFATVAVIATLSVFLFKMVVGKATKTFGSIIGGIVNALLIMVLSIYGN